MSNIVVKGSVLPNIPWEDRPQDCKDIVWRSKKNPIITRDAVPDANSIFNSAVVPFEDGFAGVFRCDNTARMMQLHAGTSRDGIAWQIEAQRIRFKCADSEIGKFVYGYDPRVCWLEDRYYVTWCNGYHGPTIGMGYTYDFKTFHQIENAFLPYNRNGVLFPRKINGKFAILSRPSDAGHTPFGDIFYSTSPDMEHWGHHRFVMGPKDGWQSTKVGGGPVPIETSEGWLVFYHGVITSCNGFEYSFGAALLDLDRPWQVMYRTRPYLMGSREMYERVGDTPNVVFPCAALVDSATNRIAVYYGAADTVVALAFAHVDKVVEFVKNNSEL
jgi:beta-1,4-mannooligosaccharide/beta-1,4-mannosyl-N-acetylglucosamine phosphorylase